MFRTEPWTQQPGIHVYLHIKIWSYLLCFPRIRLALNIAVDIAAILGSAFLVKRDLAAQDARMARMEIGAKLAGLKVRMQVLFMPHAPQF